MLWERGLFCNWNRKTHLRFSGMPTRKIELSICTSFSSPGWKKKICWHLLRMKSPHFSCRFILVFLLGVTLKKKKKKHSVSPMKGQTVEEQGAELILSGTKLVKGREFALTLKLQKSSTDSVSAEEVYQAMIRATCYSERDPQTVIRTCHCCKGSLITFESTDPNAFGFKQNSDGSTEFTLTRCRPNCSSSRDHIKSQLFVAVTGIGPLGLSARTKPFSIVSKDLTPKPSQRNQLIIK